MPAHIKAVLTATSLAIPTGSIAAAAASASCSYMSPPNGYTS
jgi:hypothetical protein